METETLNEIDSRIVNLLVENARISFSEIGKQVGLSRVAVKNRVRALEKNGVIKGYHAEVERLASPQAVSFYAYFYISSSGKFGEILNEIKSIPSVRYVCRLSGGNAIVVFGITDSERHLQNFSWRFQNRKEIESVVVKEIWSIENGSACHDNTFPYSLTNNHFETPEDKQ